MFNMNKEVLAKKWSYEFEYWLESFQSPPIELVKSVDRSESYEMDRTHIFKLEDGRYAVVNESGCSCYDPSVASIEILPTLEKAERAFAESVHSVHYNTHEDCELCKTEKES